MANRSAVRVAIAALAVALVVLGVSVYRKSADSQPTKMAAMSKEEEAACDLVQKYLISEERLPGANNGRIWVEGVVTDKDVWPFRVVRIDSAGKVTVIATGTVDLENYSLDAQPEVRPGDKARLESIHDFKLDYLEVDRINRGMGSGSDPESGTAAVRLGFVDNGWIGKSDKFVCLWLEGKHGDWVDFVRVRDGGGPDRDFTLCTFGRANLSTHEIEYNQYTLF